ncbi:MAG: TetR/AcrR family transcriptional regulator [Burkholderiaceae bacterium]|nr:TetR/AcrR family transcriptional regulator [Burkholderiaceae bacterium]
MKPATRETVATQPKRRKEARRSEILAAAREVFASKPFEGASVSEIAARASCVEGTIYTVFRNKRALFDAVLVQFYDALIADIEPHFNLIRGTRDRLRYLVARHLRIAVDSPDIASMIMRESRAHSVYFGSTLHALNRRYSSFIQRTLAEGVERGELRADLDLALARDMVFGALEHWIWNQLARRRSFDALRVAEEIVSMLLEGWSTRAEAAEFATLSRRLERVESKVLGSPAQTRPQRGRPRSGS